MLSFLFSLGYCIPHFEMKKTSLRFIPEFKNALPANVAEKATVNSLSFIYVTSPNT